MDHEDRWKAIVLRKSLVAVGLVLVFVGLILMSTYNSSVTSESYMTIDEVNGDWKIAGDFSPGDNMTVLVVWSALTFGEELGELPANVTITVNNETAADFQLFFLTDPNTPPGQDQRQRAFVARIEVLHSEDNSLQVNNPPRQIGGIVKQAGTYETRVKPPPDSFPWAGNPPQPPDALRLYRTEIKTAYPYRFLFPLGAVTIVFGGILSIWATKADRGAVRAKKLRSRRSR